LDTQKSPSEHHRTTLWGYIFATKACIDIFDNRKNLLSSNISSRCPYNMVNFGPLTAKIDWRVWGTPANFNGFRVLAALLHGTLLCSSGRQPNCRVAQRAPPILGAKSAEIGDTPSFLGHAVHNGWQDRKADGRVNSAEVLSTLCKNLVKFGSLTPEFMVMVWRPFMRQIVETLSKDSRSTTMDGRNR